METRVATDNGRRDRLMQVRALVSTLERRMELARKAGLQFGGDRETWKTLGYPERVHIEFQKFLGKFLREDIAARIVEMPAEATWSAEPQVMELDARGEPVEGSGFAADVEVIFDRTRAIPKMKRVDVLAGIGRYGVMLIGTRDGEDLTNPLAEGSLKGPEDVLFLSVFHEGDAPLDDLVEDETDPRFGLPEFYRLHLIAAEVFDEKARNKRRKIDRHETVHWSRVVHVADGLTDDEVFGTPRLERVYHLLEDKMKFVHGAAEMFWSNVGGLLHGDVDMDVELARDEDGKSEEDVLEEITDRLIEIQLKGARRAFASRGISLEHIQSEHPDPSGLFEVWQALISAATGIPKRILFGSERGELASSQDTREWLSRMSERQARFAGPTIVAGLVDRLLSAGALTLPEGHSFEVQWPDLFRLTDLERAEMAASLAGAARDLTPMGGDPAQAIEQVLALAEGDIQMQEAAE